MENSAWISCYCLKCLDESFMVTDPEVYGDRLGVMNDSVESLWLVLQRRNLGVRQTSEDCVNGSVSEMGNGKFGMV